MSKRKKHITAMDLSFGVTEAFNRLHEFHERFNSTVQITLAATITIRRLVDAPNGQYIMNSLVQSTRMPWPPNPRYKDATVVINQAIETLGQMATVEAVSAFDYFTLNLITNLTQFSSALRASGPFNHAHTSVICDQRNPVEFCVCCSACAVQYCDNHRLVIRVQDFCRDLSISDADIDGLLGLFHYFRLARNCIAHASGRANKEFADYCHSTELTNSIEYWSGITRKKGPDLPCPLIGQPIALTMAHAIMASAICYRIGKALNKHSAQKLGVQGFVHMAAFYSLFSAHHEFRRDQHRFPESPITNFLANRYRVRDVTRLETVQVARKIGIWNDIMRRFETVYPN